MISIGSIVVASAGSLMYIVGKHRNSFNPKQCGRIFIIVAILHAVLPR